jgi:hypothetical protein
MPAPTKEGWYPLPASVWEPAWGREAGFQFSGFSFQQAVVRGVVRVLSGGELSGTVLPVDSPACRLPQRVVGIRSPVQVWEPAWGRRFG